MTDKMSKEKFGNTANSTSIIVAIMVVAGTVNNRDV